MDDKLAQQALEAITALKAQNELLLRALGGDKSAAKVVTSELLAKAQRPGGVTIGDAGDTLSDFASADSTDAIRRGVAKRRADAASADDERAEAARLLKERGVLAPRPTDPNDRIAQMAKNSREGRDPRDDG